MAFLNRREFLKNSLLGISGAVLSGPAIASQGQDTSTNQAAPIIRRKLGRTGLMLPVVSMGVMRSDNPGLVRAALKAGMVHLDTAHGYQKGRNEVMLGEVLKEYPRDSFVIATKIPPDSTDDFLEKLDISLARLNMDYVDILYVHALSSRDDVLDQETIVSVQAAKMKGKTRYIGVSTHKNEPEVIRAAAESGVYDVVLTAINFRQDHREEVQKAIGEAAAAGVGIIAMKTMAGGFLDKERTRPINCSAALKWVLRDGNVTTSIPGITGYDQLAENASVNHNLSMTEQEKADLTLSSMEGGLYCNNCDHCTSLCRHSLPIAELMRAYMYTYGYGRPGMGQDLLRRLPLRTAPCAGCDTCTANCVKGFDLRERIRDIIRLNDVPEELLA